MFEALCKLTFLIFWGQQILACFLKITDGFYLNFVLTILILYNINMNGCTRLAFFITLSWRADKSYLWRKSRNFLKSMKLIYLLSFSAKFEMHLSRDFCSWCNCQQESVSVYIFWRLFEIYWHNVIGVLQLAKKFSATRWKCLHEKIVFLYCNLTKK